MTEHDPAQRRFAGAHLLSCRKLWFELFAEFHNFGIGPSCASSGELIPLTLTLSHGERAGGNVTLAVQTALALPSRSAHRLKDRIALRHSSFHASVFTGGHCVDRNFCETESPGKKLQIPNSKEAPSSKPARRLPRHLFSGFGVFDLELLWSLGFGAWCFAQRRLKKMRRRTLPPCSLPGNLLQVLLPLMSRFLLRFLTVLNLAVLFLTRPALADSAVVFNEIMYHPASNEAALEWLELHNQMAVNMDLSRWSLDGGVQFKFAEGTVVPGGGYLVVAVAPPALAAVTGYTN